MKFTLKDTSIAKGFALLCMYVHHFYLSADRYAGYAITFWPFTQSQVTKLAVFLKICVALFLFLSGYGMYVQMAKAKEQSWKAVVLASARRYIKLLMGFVFIFWLVQIVFFYTGRWQQIYGTGLQALVYFGIDMLGLAKLFGTPTYLGTWWYISLISLIIWIFPILYKAFARNPILTCLVIALLCIELNSSSALLARWLPVFMAGMCFARFGVFEKVNALFVDMPVWQYWLCGLCVTLLAFQLILFRQASGMSIVLKDAIIASLLVLYVFLWIARIPFVSALLDGLGKHSMTMFLTHTLIRVTFFQDFSYGFYSAWLNLLVFTMVTWLLAAAIDWLESACGWRKCIARVVSYI